MQIRKPKHNYMEVAELYNPDWIMPDVIHGENLIRQATDTSEKYAVLTMEIPWDLVKNEVKNPPAAVVFVPDMKKETMEQILLGLPDGLEMVIGLGGGTAHDSAKYMALKKNLRVVLMPTIFGGDAAACDSVGLRVDGKVQYIGNVDVDKIFLDFDVIRKAPSDLVIYGVGDILSTYTAQLDWKHCVSVGKAKPNDDIQHHIQSYILDSLRKAADDIRNLTNDGILTIMDLYLENMRLIHNHKDIFTQEASEHFFAYNMEYVTGRTFIHGKLLALGIFISAAFLHNKRNEVEDYFKALGLDYDLATVGLSEDELRRVLQTQLDFVRSDPVTYFHTKINDSEFTPEFVDYVCAEVVSL